MHYVACNSRYAERPVVRAVIGAPPTGGHRRDEAAPLTVRVCDGLSLPQFKYCAVAVGT